MHLVCNRATVIGYVALAGIAVSGRPLVPASETVVVTDAWSRPALKGGTGVAYMLITNTGRTSVRFTGATAVDATTTELHESTVHDGMAHMQRLPKLEIAAGATVALTAGGMHFMLVGLRKTFVKGDSTRVTLQLDGGNTVIVNVAIRLQ